MKMLNALQVFESGEIYWVKSYRSILLYMKKYAHILKPETNGESGRGKRYRVSEENVSKLVTLFEKGELD